MASYGQLLSGGSTWGSGLGRSELEPGGPPGREAASEDTAGPSSSSAASSRASIPQSKMKIVVSDPVQREESGLLPGVMGKFTSYGIKTQTNRPGYQQQDFSARRRFRDFVVRISLHMRC